MADWFMRLVPVSPKDILGAATALGGFSVGNKHINAYRQEDPIGLRYWLCLSINETPIRLFRLAFCRLGDGRITGFLFFPGADPVTPLLDRLYTQYPRQENTLHPVLKELVTTEHLPEWEISRIRMDEQDGYHEIGFSTTVFGLTGEPEKLDVFDQFYLSTLVHKFEEEDHELD